MDFLFCLLYVIVYLAAGFVVAYISMSLAKKAGLEQKECSEEAFITIWAVWPAMPIVFIVAFIIAILMSPARAIIERIYKDA